MDKKEGGWFIDSREGNIKEAYHFIQKLAHGGFGIVYLAEHRKTGKSNFPSLLYMGYFLHDTNIFI